jgi:hypothetical protein
MDVRNLWILPLTVYTDEVLRLSYLKYLTKSKFETLKLPIHLTQYNDQHLLNPSNLILVEVVRTKKNWILRNILQTREIIKIREYVDYIKFAQLTKTIMNYFQEESEVEILELIINLFTTYGVENLDLKKLEEDLECSLGFK